MNTNKHPPIDKKIVSDKARKNFFPAKNLSGDDLAKIMRRAVKSVFVPADLESKITALLREQS